MATWLTPELVAQLISAATTFLMLALYHWKLGPTKQHPFLDTVLAKVDNRTKAAVESTAEAFLDFAQGKTAPASPPAKQ